MKISIHNLKLTTVCKPCDDNCIGVVDSMSMANKLIRDAVAASKRSSDFEPQTSTDYLMIKHNVGDLEGYFDSI